MFKWQGRFLSDSGSYVNKIKELFGEDVFQKRKLVSFFNGVSYDEGVIPPDAASRKQLKWFMETHLLVEFDSKEARKIIFGE